MKADEMLAVTISITKKSEQAAKTNAIWFLFSISLIKILFRRESVIVSKAAVNVLLAIVNNVFYPEEFTSSELAASCRTRRHCYAGHGTCIPIISRVHNTVCPSTACPGAISEFIHNAVVLPTLVSS
ncbi:uncharacterized protein LOC109414867 [Aedes albopictus]|uniref:Secreted protein n=1 Tax=Aedes albopictus TaxID=7160 RepID=A0ABM1ZPE8_AEDAL